jgi:hypothetical protein
LDACRVGDIAYDGHILMYIPKMQFSVSI